MHFTTHQKWVLLLVTFTLHLTSGQLLTVEYSNATLPFPESSVRAFYSSGDKIYLFGGDFEMSSGIWSFSISSETIEYVTPMPGRGARGTTQSDTTGNIYYLGGGNLGSSDQVYKFDPATNQCTLVATLPQDVQDSVSIKYNETSDMVYIFGGDGQFIDILTYDLTLFNTTSQVDALPVIVNGGTGVRVGNKAYIFSEGQVENTAALELDLDILRMMAVGPANLPSITLFPSSVYDSRHVYLIGGYAPDPSNITTRTDGIIQFDPVSFNNEFIPVANFPVEGASYFRVSPATIYVPDLNRIYFFGGSSFNYTTDTFKIHDEIFYIDLAPLTPPPTGSSTDVFSCEGRMDGFYPHPTNCGMYIECINNEETVFNCEPDQQFDLIMKTCNFGTTCIDLIA